MKQKATNIIICPNSSVLPFEVLPGQDTSTLNRNLKKLQKKFRKKKRKKKVKHKRKKRNKRRKKSKKKRNKQNIKGTTKLKSIVTKKS